MPTAPASQARRLLRSHTLAVFRTAMLLGNNSAAAWRLRRWKRNHPARQILEQLKMKLELKQKQALMLKTKTKTEQQQMPKKQQVRPVGRTTNRMVQTQNQQQEEPRIPPQPQPHPATSPWQQQNEQLRPYLLRSVRLACAGLCDI